EIEALQIASDGKLNPVVDEGASGEEGRVVSVRRTVPVEHRIAISIKDSSRDDLSLNLRNQHRRQVSQIGQCTHEFRRIACSKALRNLEPLMYLAVVEDVASALGLSNRYPTLIALTNLIPSGLAVGGKNLIMRSLKGQDVCPCGIWLKASRT